MKIEGGGDSSDGDGGCSNSSSSSNKKLRYVRGCSASMLHGGLQRAWQKCD